MQFVTNFGNTGQPATSTLAAFGSSGNGSYGAAGFATAQTFTPGTGMATLGDAQSTQELVTEWAAGNISPVQVNWSSSTDAWGIVGIELAAAPGTIPSIIIGGNIQVN